MNISKTLKNFLIFFTITLIVPPAYSSDNKSEIIFKVKKENALLFGNQKMPESIINVLKNYSYSLEKKFPNHKSISEQDLSRNPKLVDLSLMYTISVQNCAFPQKLVSELFNKGYFEYVEEKVFPQLLYTPNDPSISQQYHIALIQALEGFDIQQGDTNVVVGITDTGAELLHPELQPQIKYNYNDPLDGTDNDNDGFIDNFRGWDLGSGDNNPSPDGCATCSHGVHVSGLSSAATDNNIGIAGTGFKCKFLPVKIQNASGALNAAYEGIVYAADHGCRIINCSWGGNSGGQYGQDIVNYATFNKNSLVIAAAGNNGNNGLFYPASFQNVLSVAATDNFDLKWVQSNYGYKIDICAPGVNVYSTWVNSGYTSSSGTSMAAPVVSGVAALVLSQFPNLTALQIGEQLKNTADSIEYLSSNSDFVGYLGAGRVNLFRALSLSNNPAVQITQHQFSDNNDNVFINSDTVRLTATFKNYLSNSSNLLVTIRSMSSNLEMIDSVFNIGVLNTLTETSNINPFSFKILPGTPINAELLLKVIYTDTSYFSFEYLPIIVNVDYINVAINNIATSATSRSLIGYNSNNTSQGLGFKFDNSISLLYEGGLMIGDRPGRVMDKLRIGSGQFNNDWFSIQNVYKLENPTYSEIDVIGKMTDIGAAINPIGLEVTHKTFAWSSPGNENFVFFNYTIKNVVSEIIDSLYVGIFADWDIMNYNLNKTDFNSDLDLAYSFSTQNNGLYSGIKLINSQASVNSYAIDIVTGGAGGINLADGFTDVDKYTALSTQRLSSGGTGSGNDIASTLSTGPFEIQPNDSIEVTFALLAAYNLDELLQTSNNAQIKFNNILTNIRKSKTEKLTVVPNPASNSFTIYPCKDDSVLLYEIYSSDGRLIESISGNTIFPVFIENEKLNNGLYYITSISKTDKKTSKFIINK
jgi:serine protease